MKNSNLYTRIFSAVYLLVLLLWFAGAETGVYDFGNYNYNIQEYHFKPYIGLLLGSALDALPSILARFISIVLVPFGIFYMLTLVFSRHVNSLWTIFLALLSVSVFESFPFRSFITGSSANLFDTPLITQYPFPGISTLIFLTIYYFISKIRKLKTSQIISFTIVCSLFFYINALESLFLLGFWFLFFGSRLTKVHHWKSIQFIGIVLLQVALVCAIVLYGLVHGEVVGYQEMAFGQYFYHILAYYIFPVLLMLGLYLIKRIDPYEIWFKFRHVYGFLAIEVGIVILSQLSIMPINTEILNSRISQFFLHLFYYTPVIYYLARPYQEYHKGIEAKPLMKKLRFLLNKTYPIFERAFAFIISLILIIYNIYPLILKWTA